MNDFEKNIIANFYLEVKLLYKTGQLPTREDVPNILSIILQRMENYPTANLNNEFKNINKQKIIDFLLTKIDTGVGQRLKLIDETTDHIDWLSKVDKTNWYFQKRFYDYLSSKPTYGPASANDIFDSADDILSLLENPKRPGKWRTQGLVFGNVQSGKTSSYSALINKAVDAGYKYIIVLGGLNKNLRSQTQIALEENFTGKKTPDRVDSTTGKVGVGNLPDYSDIPLKINVYTTRADNGDFKKSDLQRLANYNPDNSPHLFVLKKNASPLKYLLEYLIGKIGDENGIDEPLLLIDDECDNGSVNTNKPEKQPTRFNAYIRAILSLFKKCAYVAYTATPFANIFINPSKSTFKIQFDGQVLRDEDGYAQIEIKNNRAVKKLEKIEKEVEDSDLFPRDFIINLPDNNEYVGAKKLFDIPDDLDETKETNILPVVKTTEQILNYNQDKITLEEKWIPAKHRSDHIFKYDNDENLMSPTLEYSIKCFLLSIAARIHRFDKYEHNTMLINVTNWNNTQQQIFDLVEAKVKEITNGIQGNFEDCLENLKNIWENDFLITTKELNQRINNNSISINHGHMYEEIDWDIIKKNLKDHKITRDIKVHKVYGNNKDVLLYDSYEETGLNVIAVGAIKLSRGLVLKNLTISYFKRPAKQYDTLLQMGRWFGYRPNYLDLCRLVLDENLLERFERSAWASEQLKSDFKTMNRFNGSPKDWGHRVRTFPDAEQLIPTSKNKMLSATTYNLSFEDKRVETTRWSLNHNDVLSNISTFNDFLSKIKKLEVKNEKKENLLIFRNASSENILQFLKKYISPASIEKNARVNELIEFLTNCNLKGKLKNWDVFVKTKMSSDFFESNGYKFGLLKRTPFSGRSKNVLKEGKDYIIKERKKIFIKESFENPSDLIKKYYFLGGVADKDLAYVIEDQAILDRALITTRENNKTADVPSEEMIRKELHAGKGYMGFYLFDPKGCDDEVLKNFYKNADSPLIGYSMTFPDKLDVTYEYVINIQKQKELQILEELEDEIDDDEDFKE